jgi:hypothetical protein
MKTKSFAERVLGTTSLVVLSAAAMIGAQQQVVEPSSEEAFADISRRAERASDWIG